MDLGRSQEVELEDQHLLLLGQDIEPVYEQQEASTPASPQHWPLLCGACLSPRFPFTAWQTLLLADTEPIPLSFLVNRAPHYVHFTSQALWALSDNFGQ